MSGALAVVRGRPSGGSISSRCKLRSRGLPGCRTVACMLKHSSSREQQQQQQQPGLRDARPTGLQATVDTHTHGMQHAWNGIQSSTHRRPCQPWAPARFNLTTRTRPLARLIPHACAHARIHPTYIHQTISHPLTHSLAHRPSRCASAAVHGTSPLTGVSTHESTHRVGAVVHSQAQHVVVLAARTRGQGEADIVMSHKVLLRLGRDLGQADADEHPGLTSPLPRQWKRSAAKLARCCCGSGAAWGRLVRASSLLSWIHNRRSTYGKQATSKPPASRLGTWATWQAATKQSASRLGARAT